MTTGVTPQYGGTHVAANARYPLPARTKGDFQFLAVSSSPLVSGIIFVATGRSGCIVCLGIAEVDRSLRRRRALVPRASRAGRDRPARRGCWPDPILARRPHRRPPAGARRRVRARLSRPCATRHAGPHQRDPARGICTGVIVLRVRRAARASSWVVARPRSPVELRIPRASSRDRVRRRVTACVVACCPRARPSAKRGASSSSIEP